MPEGPFITGIGLVTPLGTGASATWDALLAGRYIPTHSQCAIQGVDAIALAAAREALDQARWQLTRPLALILGTSKGAICDWIAPPPHIAGAAYMMGGLSDTAARLAESLNLPAGPRMTLSAACASGLHALIWAAMMIRSGEIARALVVAAEASVHPLFLGSFNRLGVLPREEVGCRPFDEDRDGFLMSEAAAAVCLEAHPEERPLTAIDRFALGGDATHLTGSDPDGYVLRRLLRDVTAGRAVELVHAHATGTPTHDPTELAAIEFECIHDEVVPEVYSHKGALGHSLGAAGLMSVAINCLVHKWGVIPPNVRTLRPIRTERVRISREAIHRPVHRSIAVAAGFGGAMAAVSLRS